MFRVRESDHELQGELVTPSRCGRMDQACAFGSRPVVMTYDGEFVDVSTIQVPKPVHLVIVDLCAKKDTVEILAKLQSCFPFAKNEDEGNVQRLLGPINQDITERAIAAIERGDIESLGALMTEAQTAFDKFAGKVCPSQLTAPVLHKVLGHAPLASHTYGGKGVGAGGDGTAQLLCRSAADQALVADILQRDFGMPSLFLTIEASQPVRKALIPAAGFGAGLFPATKCVRPELFPVIDADGIAKPAILLNVEDLLNAGIEEVVIIVQAGDLPIFEKLFKEKLSPSNYHKLSAKEKKYADELVELGKRVQFVVQNKQDGFGHAVWCARECIGNHPFMVMLGDHVYKSHAKGGVSCTAQLLQQYLRVTTSIVGMSKSPIEDVPSYGCATGTWLDHDDASGVGRRSFNISELAEKPSVEYARSKLLMPALGVNEVVTIFGMYVVTPTIFEVLDDMIHHNIRSANGDFQFTAALEILRKREGVQGYVLEGERFDIGTPEHYFCTLAALHDGIRARSGSATTLKSPASALREP
jgi:UTP-glucose-1-phosphate uridylyltransferase